MSQAPQQLTLDLTLRSARDREDFLVSPSNEAAVALIDRWPDWPGSSALVLGPASSGKSHLANVWQSISHADLMSASALDDTAVMRFQHDGAPALIVEDLDRGISNERVLFHLLNQARETSRSILLTSRIAPGDLLVDLPDLRSRLRALPVLEIAPPDDALLSAVLIKLFADRQLTIEPTVISHILRHMERSMAAANAVVTEIDRLALARQRKVSRATAAEALANIMSTNEGL
jgi:chromosomal replication initiation ATPase DnaA